MDAILLCCTSTSMLLMSFLAALLLARAEVVGAVVGMFDGGDIGIAHVPVCAAGG